MLQKRCFIIVILVLAFINANAQQKYKDLFEDFIEKDLVYKDAFFMAMLYNKEINRIVNQVFLNFDLNSHGDKYKLYKSLDKQSRNDLFIHIAENLYESNIDNISNTKRYMNSFFILFDNLTTLSKWVSYSQEEFFTMVKYNPISRKTIDTYLKRNHIRDVQSLSTFQLDELFYHLLSELAYEPPLKQLEFVSILYKDFLEYLDD
jgi:hypothetical protein